MLVLVLVLGLVLVVGLALVVAIGLGVGVLLRVFLVLALAISCVPSLVPRSSQSQLFFEPLSPFAVLPCLWSSTSPR